MTDVKEAQFSVINLFLTHQFHYYPHLSKAYDQAIAKPKEEVKVEAKNLLKFREPKLLTKRVQIIAKAIFLFVKLFFSKEYREKHLKAVDALCARYTAIVVKKETLHKPINMSPIRKKRKELTTKSVELAEDLTRLEREQKALEEQSTFIATTIKLVESLQPVLGAFDARLTGETESLSEEITSLKTAIGKIESFQIKAKTTTYGTEKTALLQEVFELTREHSKNLETLIENLRESLRFQQAASKENEKPQKEVSQAKKSVEQFIETTKEKQKKIQKESKTLSEQIRKLIIKKGKVRSRASLAHSPRKRPPSSRRPKILLPLGMENNLATYKQVSPFLLGFLKKFPKGTVSSWKCKNGLFDLHLREQGCRLQTKDKRHTLSFQPNEGEVVRGSFKGDLITFEDGVSITHYPTEKEGVETTTIVHTIQCHDETCTFTEREESRNLMSVLSPAKPKPTLSIKVPLEQILTGKVID